MIAELLIILGVYALVGAYVAGIYYFMKSGDEPHGRPIEAPGWTTRAESALGFGTVHSESLLAVK